jgi:polyphenol oxidase
MQDVVLMSQVHGNNIIRVNFKDVGTTISRCDALITNDPGVTLCVRVADCLPISVVDKKGRGIGIIHAGWRGLEKGIIEKTIQKMTKEFSLDSRNFEVTVGPHICQKDYEVKSDVSAKFNDIPGAIFAINSKEYLDLVKVSEFQLIKSGVKKENIKVDRRCTFEDISLYSYRRNKTPDRNLYFLHLLGVK